VFLELTFLLICLHQVDYLLQRVTICLEILEMSRNLTAVRELSKSRGVSENLVKENCLY